MAIAGRAQGAPNISYDVAAIRKDFPIFETGIAYLDSANTSQRPRQVTGAINNGNNTFSL